MLLDTGHGWLEVCIFETGVPPRFRIYPCKASGETVPLPKGTQLGIETARLDGRTQKFAFEAKDTFWEATSELPEPHEFLAVVSLGHSDHAHTYRLRFTEEHHGHSHAPVAVEEPEDDGVEYQDAHERAHAQDIAKRFANRAVTTPQIVLFGITGGLMPCPAAFTILLVCLQVKKVVLGFSLVAAFSFGLASRWSSSALWPRGASTTRRSDSAASANGCAAHLTFLARCSCCSPPSWLAGLAGTIATPSAPAMNFSKLALSAIIAVILLVLMPSTASAIRPMGTTMTGVVQSVDHSTRWITFSQDGGPVRQFVYSEWAKFWHDEKEALPAHLKPGMRVQIKLHNPLIGPDFVRQIVLIAQP
jgi:hypothetical protein